MRSFQPLGNEEAAEAPVFIHSFKQIGSDYSWQESAAALGTSIEYLKRLSKLSPLEQEVILGSLRQKKIMHDRQARSTDSPYLDE